MGTTLERADATSGRHPALHIDVLADRQRIADLLFDQEPDISVGRSRLNQIVLPDPDAPRSLPLFHRRDGGYALHYTDETEGAIAVGPDGTWHTLAELEDASSQHQHGFDLALEVGTRGRIDVGAETVLFEVMSLPDRPRPAAWRWVVTGLSLLAGLSLLVAIALVAWAAAQRTSARVSAATAPMLAAPRAEATPPSSAPTSTLPAAQPLPPVTLAAPRKRAAPPAGRGRSQIAMTGTLRPMSPMVLPTAPVSLPPLLGPNELPLGSPSYTSDGLLRPEVIVHELTLDEGGIRAVYERALRSDPSLAGDVVARIVLDSDGHVSRVSIVRDTVGSPELRRSVQSLLSNWRAPLPAAQPAEYQLPFHFRPRR